MDDHINVTNTIQALVLMEQGYHLVLIQKKIAISFCVVDGEVYNISLNRHHVKNVKIGALDREWFVKYLKTYLKENPATAAKDDELYKTVEKVIRENQDKFK